MTKQELIECVSEGTAKPQAEVEQVLDAVLDEITQQLGGDETVIHLGPLGTFSLRDEDEHVGSDPNTHEPVDYPAYTRVLFHPSPTLHLSVNS